MAAENDGTLPLARFRVLDLTRVRAGPACVRQLADWGADTIKIEAPARIDGGGAMGGPRLGADFQNLHRNKRSLTLNLKHEQGVEILRRLVAQADVLVENYRPEVKDRLGIDAGTMAAVNPRLVYASISGFGQDGPYRTRTGVDQIAQGMGGLMSITGLPGQGPVRAGIPVADLSAGLYAAFGILMALLARETTGHGAWIRTSLLEAQIAMLDFQAARWLVAGEVAGQAGNDHPTVIPTGVFPTRDGHINVAAGGDAHWRRLCGALGAEALAERPDFADDEARSTHRTTLNNEIAERTRTYSSAALLELLAAADVPAGPINGIDAVFADAQVRHLGIARPLVHPALGAIALVGQPITTGTQSAPIRHAAPALGEHTDEILGEIGFTATDIKRLRQLNVV